MQYITVQDDDSTQLDDEGQIKVKANQSTVPPVQYSTVLYNSTLRVRNRDYIKVRQGKARQDKSKTSTRS
jgi:hypothetical protein